MQISDNSSKYPGDWQAVSSRNEKVFRHDGKSQQQSAGLITCVYAFELFLFFPEHRGYCRQEGEQVSVFGKSAKK